MDSVGYSQSVRLRRQHLLGRLGIIIEVWISLTELSVEGFAAIITLKSSRGM